MSMDVLGIPGELEHALYVIVLGSFLASVSNAAFSTGGDSLYGGSSRGGVWKGTLELTQTRVETAARQIALQVAAQGIPTMVISIPLRYMHTPVEVVALNDIHRTARLLAEFITRLEIDYMEKLSFEEPS